MINKIFLMGRLTRDPEMRHTQNGTAVASFSIAVDRDFKDKQSGEKVTDFVDMWPGAAQRNSWISISARAGWPWWKAACRSETGQIRTATSDAAQRS